MEQTIETLLNDFEQGKMNRRQLIKHLAMAASLAAPAAAAAQSTTAKAPWKTVHLDHISYSVSDYKKSAAWYSNLMGWEIANDNGKNQATLRIGEVGEIIIRNSRRPEGAMAAAPAAAAGQPARPPVTGVINHVSYGIAPWDTDGVKAELEKRGLNPRPDMVGDDFKSYHVLDPDGWDLQISNQTKIG
ncbi:MAG TPA: VOC family protein [Vicinamibacterales bacterium]|nr:VOC family protein [Vicinamibacterales bacterium]